MIQSIAGLGKHLEKETDARISMGRRIDSDMKAQGKEMQSHFGSILSALSTKLDSVGEDLQKWKD